MKILICVDGSPYTRHMLAYLATHDELLGREGQHYTLLTVVTPVPAHAARFVDHQILAGHYTAQADEVFKPVLAFAAQQHWTVQHRHLVGHAAESIAAFAEEGKFDLLVMGTHGHSALGNMVLGSVTTGVLARCKVPALLIR